VNRRIGAINGIRMEGVSQCDLEIAGGLCAALAHSNRFLVETLTADIQSRFKNREDFGVMLFCKRENVAEVIAVGMRKKNGVELWNFFERFGASGICRDPGINQRHLAGRRCEREGAVAEVGDTIAFCVEHGKSPEG